MNAAERMFRTAAAAGIEVCFANPGTSELPLVAAIDAVEGIRAELCLFEGVCTGAADGYARMAGRPALTMLHTGPGLANGLANLHNARRAESPVVNLIGDQPTWHLPFDAPLTSDIEAIARTASGWVDTARPGGNAAGDLGRAIAAALTPPGHVASLIVPLDCMWEDAPEPPPATPPAPPPAAVEERTVTAIAEALGAAGTGALMLGGAALGEDGLWAAARIAAATGCRMMCRTAVRRLERGAGLPAVERLPYFPDAAIAMLAGLSDLVLAGTGEPVTFFGYREYPSRCAPEACRRHVLARPGEDAVGALDAVADLLGAPQRPGLASPTPPPPPSAGPLNADTLAAAIAAAQPEGAIVVDEGVTAGRPVFAATAAAPRHTYMTVTGGSIGFGMPAATGAAIACPERPVLNLEADGSALYTVQALWNQARGGLDVTTVIFSNRGYRILEVERQRTGLPAFGPRGRGLIELDRPPLDWVALSAGFGVPAVRVAEVAAFGRELARAFAEPGPHLIEAVM